MNTPRFRGIIKRLHPEGIPGPAASLYDRLSGSRIFQRHYELVAKDIMSHTRQGSLLDVGTGPGWLLIKVHELSPGLRLVGLDASPAMVEMARTHIARAGLSDAVEVLLGNAGEMPFPDASFDTVVSTGSIHHWKDPVSGLNEVYRVLKPGGCALIYDLVRGTPRHILRETRREFGLLRIMLFWLHAFEEPFYTQKRLESLAGSTLFRAGETRYLGLLCCLVLRKPA
jgi:ubiquinone/menaquinone biosynthesis C-methylase UbiE